MMSPGEFAMCLFFIGVGFLLVGFVVVPFLMDSLVEDDATWEFHNSIVQDKYAIETKGFPLGNTKYYITIDNHTTEIEQVIWQDIIPNHTTLGYYTNNKTNEIRTSWHT